MSSPADPIPYTLTLEGEQVLAAAQQLRRTLAHYARAEHDGVVSISPPKPGIPEMVSAMRKSGFDVRDVDDLLDEFEDISDRGCRAIELHLFAGLPPEQIAALMQIPERVAERDVAVARAWLFERLKELTTAQS